MSGGQGTDEPCPEAQAMARYAQGQGIPAQQIAMEGRSTTTLENMLLSKELMEEIQQGKRYRCIYSTSNYHVLRAGIYARKAGLKIDGIGARTALYYLPNALLREFIALLWQRRLRNGIIMAGLFAIGFMTQLSNIFLPR